MAKSLRQVAKTFNNTRWDEAIKPDLLSIPQKPLRVRMYNHICTIKQHYVEFRSNDPKKGMTGFYELCLNWDPVEDKEIEGNCPMCDSGMQPTTHNYAYVIVRKKDADPKQPLVVPVRMTGKLTGSILKLSNFVFPEGPPEGWEGEELPDATDPKFGFDIFLSKEENNKKTDYVANQTQNVTPLNKFERQAFEEYIADGHDVAQLAKAGVRPRSEVYSKLVKLNVIKGGASSNQSSGGGKKSYDNLDDEEQVPGGDEDAAVPAPRTGKKPAPQVDDDDDQEAAAPPVKPPKAGQQRRSLPWDEGDEEEAPAPKPRSGTSRTIATPDDDDVPSDDE